MFSLECLNVKVQGQKTLTQDCHSKILKLLSRGLEKELKFSEKPPVFQQKPQDSKNFWEALENTSDRKKWQYVDHICK